MSICVPRGRIRLAQRLPDVELKVMEDKRGQKAGLVPSWESGVPLAVTFSECPFPILTVNEYYRQNYMFIFL